MIHHTTQIDTDAQRIMKPQRSGQELRAAMVQIRTEARKIRSGDYDPRPVGIRMMRQYGNTVPMNVILRCTVSYRRMRDLGHQLRIAMVIGAEHESFVIARQEMRIANHARMVRSRRRYHISAGGAARSMTTTDAPGRRCP